MGYFVSRQRDYKDNCLYVEVAVGKTNAGKDILTSRYPGEQKNLVDPRDAIRIAEEIYRKWDRDYGDEKKRLKIISSNISIYEFSAMGIAAARNWADNIYKSMTKCGSCNRPISSSKQTYEHEHLVNLIFCTEACCGKRYRDVYGQEPEKIYSGPQKKGLKK